MCPGGGRILLVTDVPRPEASGTSGQRHRRERCTWRARVCHDRNAARLPRVSAEILANSLRELTARSERSGRESAWCVRPTSGTGRIAGRIRTRGKEGESGGWCVAKAPTAVAGSRVRYAARPWRSRHAASTCADARSCRYRNSEHRECRRRDGQETHARGADAVRRCRAVALSRCRAVALSR